MRSRPPGGVCMHTHKTTRLRFTSIFLILLGLLGTSLYAQDATGRIIGVVTDATGAVVPSARIIVTNVATNISTEGTTGPDGSYQVLQLPIGSYKVSAEAQGFRKTVTSPQQLEINQSLKVD